MGLKETISNIFNFKEKEKSNDNDLTYAKMLNGQLRYSVSLEITFMQVM